jgi:hypothetical protein
MVGFFFGAFLTNFDNIIIYHGQNSNLKLLKEFFLEKELLILSMWKLTNMWAMIIPF